MPIATVFQVDTVRGDRTPITSYSYKPGESFADARHNLSSSFEFEFQFVDGRLDCRMQEKFERINRVEDFESKIVIIPKFAEGDLCNWSVPILGSSNASNGPSTTVSGDRTAPSIAPEPEDVDVAAELVPPDESQVDLTSTLMTDDLKRIWLSSAQKLREHMELIQCRDHKWSVKTWDKDDMSYGHIECLECNSRYLAAPSKKGVMDKAGITNLFTNFRSKHVRSSKHLSRVASNRGERVNSREIARRAEAAKFNDRATLDQHVAIVNKVNSAQTVGRDTFEIVGDMEKEPLELHKFKLRCYFCNEFLTMIPKQKNLECNLESHCNGLRHLNYVVRSQQPPRGDPVLSGRPGRPRIEDGRDRKQRKIQGFYRPGERNGGACSSGSSRQGGIIDNRSLLCWGLWREYVKYGSHTRPIKDLLTDQLKIEGNWYAEPLVQAEVWCPSTETSCVVKGLFRHKDCSRISHLGGGFEDLTCEKCFSIRGEDDFRLRIFRETRAIEKRGFRGTGRGRRLDYLTIPEVRYQARNYRYQVLRERKLQRILSHKLLMTRARVPRLRELCQNYDGPNKTSVLKFIHSILLAHRTNAFGGRSALWDLLSDIAQNLNRPKAGFRFKPGSKLICQTVLLHGGRRVVDCLATNGIGPSLNTLQRDRRGMASFAAGIHVEQFQFVAKIYSELKSRKHIVGPIPCFLAEDETCVKRHIRWLPKHDTLLGFCGRKLNHQCKVGLQMKVGDGDSGFTVIDESFNNNIIGHMARCVIVNPLVADFPHLCILATSTCNKFDAGEVRRQWKQMLSLWNSHCLESVGPLLGHASDGDSRRRKLMLEDYSGCGENRGPRQNLGWEGWQLSHSIINSGEYSHAYGIHDQDFIHNGKKLVNPLDSTARILKLGTEVANLSHMVHLDQLYTNQEHGLNSEDTSRTDRQNWASAQRLCSRKVGTSLKMLRERKDARVERTLGTEVYTRICADYIDVFLNTSLTLRQRVVLCAKVGFFFRIWRLWCFHGNHSVGGNTQPISFTNNCIPMQTFIDIQISVHFVVLLVIQFRDNFRQLPVPLHLTGSDVCEQFFSAVGGMRGNERSYDLSELVECATTRNRLAAMDLADGLAGAGKSHKKHSNIWMTLSPLDEGVSVHADQTDYTGIETNAEVVDALQEGLTLAQSACTELEMNPSTSARDKEWWNFPWKVEAKGPRLGGWCDINVDTLVDGGADVEETVIEEPSPLASAPTGENSGDTEARLSLEERQIFDDEEIRVVGVEVEASMDILHSDLIYGAPISEVSPTVTWMGRVFYKSTLVKEKNDNPMLSKDRMLRIKQSHYFNNLVDKPNIRAGSPTMFITVGSDCGVYFIDDTPQVMRETRSSEALSRTLRGKGRAKRPPSEVASSSKRPRGPPVAVTSVIASKYVWWIGRVQSIQKKYGARVQRSREAVDLLDRPGTEAACKVMFEWFTAIGTSRRKFLYNMSDPQLIDLDCVIQTVSLTVDPDAPKVFQLHPDDGMELDNFVRNKIV